MSAAAGAMPRAHGEPVMEARMRSVPEDFQVQELPSFEPSGSGEHLLLTIEKRGMNTAFAAKQLAEWAGVAEMAVGYAGLKDRHALTVQRFSVHLPRRVAPDLALLQRDDGLRVLEHHWHSRKLPRGALAGNRFALVLRDVVGDPEAIDQRLDRIVQAGVPNYFGEQRFGREGDNVAQALSMFAGRRVRREQRGILMSAARSALFNRVLATRAQRGDWCRALPGEVWMLDGTRSVFGPQPLDATLQERLQQMDIHPTGPLWGRGALRSVDEVAEVERAALSDPESLALRGGLERAGLSQERRALRVRPVQLSWARPTPDSLAVSFSLPAGSYATAVLAELGGVSASAPF
ncbi:tRNA pseudouridine(13) synthase TruD [Lysobacter sp. A3-1-A15]|uniref:tRNA pseudouridine(13) synthase TruD n=1 Tax=Novilysobacter viscosus TaxID=3098602 RepID=UPI002ED87EB9